MHGAGSGSGGVAGGVGVSRGCPAGAAGEGSLADSTMGAADACGPSCQAEGGGQVASAHSSSRQGAEGTAAGVSSSAGEGGPERLGLLVAEAELTDAGDGTYVAAYSATTAGLLELHIQLRCWDEPHRGSGAGAAKAGGEARAAGWAWRQVAESPFALRVAPGPPCARSSRVRGPGRSRCVAGRRSWLAVAVHDAWGNAAAWRDVAAALPLKVGRAARHGLGSGWGAGAVGWGWPRLASSGGVRVVGMRGRSRRPACAPWPRASGDAGRRRARAGAVAAAQPPGRPGRTRVALRLRGALAAGAVPPAGEWAGPDSGACVAGRTPGACTQIIPASAQCFVRHACCLAWLCVMACMMACENHITRAAPEGRGRGPGRVTACLRERVLGSARQEARRCAGAPGVTLSLACMWAAARPLAHHRWSTRPVGATSAAAPSHYW
jgi:hypothetical protein